MRLLLVVIVGLCTIQIVSDVLFYAGYIGGGLTLQMRQRFMLDAEANIPSAYSALVILVCSSAFGISAVEARVGGRWRRHLLGLSLVLLFLALDRYGLARRACRSGGGPDSMPPFLLLT